MNNYVWFTMHVVRHTIERLLFSFIYFFLFLNIFPIHIQFKSNSSLRIKNMHTVVQCIDKKKN